MILYVYSNWQMLYTSLLDLEHLCCVLNDLNVI